MRKIGSLILGTIFLCAILFLVQQVLIPSWYTAMISISLPQRYNFIRECANHSDVQDNHDKSIDVYSVRDIEIQNPHKNIQDGYPDVEKEVQNVKNDKVYKRSDSDKDSEDRRKKYESEENENHRDIDKNSGESEEDEASENARLQKSPYIVHEEEEERMMSTKPEMPKVKLISEWKLPTPFHNRFQVCRYNNCKWVKDNTKADAVLFRASAIHYGKIEPFRRKPGQRWILYTSDPAAKYFRLDGDDVGSNFNATCTYQLHSDYPRLFGKLQKIKPPQKDYEKIFEGKQKLVAWFVSHCQTWGKRELYVERMRKIIPVDVFGVCGNLTCTGAERRKQNDRTVCLPMLSEQYKFYLSFENSFCQDYVTEKFFKLFQGIDVIPVVQGAFDYKKNLPSNVFIDSSDFKTPEDLARYLLLLSRDKTRYVKILKRKARWTYKAPPPRHCVICEGLHTDTRKQHFYKDTYAAFNGRPSECYPPRWL